MEVKFNHVQYIISNEKILDNVNVKLQENQINVIMGPNGSGKSIMAQMLNALIYPSSGNIKIGKYNLTEDHKINDIDDLHFNVGLVLPNPETNFFCQTVKEEITLQLDFFKYKKEKIDKHLKDALKMVNLSEDYLERDPLSLSSSEMRKVALASVLAINPEIIVLDEPTIGLDYRAKENLIKILKTIKRRYHKTIIIISQDIEFIYMLADYIIVLNNGKIILEGNKYDVFKQDKILKQNGLSVPKIMEFELLVLKNRKIKLGYRDNLNDLVKDILRNM